MVTRARSIALVATLALGALVPTAPTLAQTPGSSAGTGSALEGTTWSITAVAGTADAAAVGDMNATIAFSDGIAHGFGGCNQFTTSYTVDGSSLTIQLPASTMMACEPPKMDFESVYLGALPQTASYSISGGTLELLDQAGASVVTATAASGPAASGVPTSIVGEWTVVDLNNGNQGVETVPADPVLTVTFQDGGTIEGFGGCNQFGGPYVIGTSTIGIGPLNATMMACGDAVDSTEQQLMLALEASRAWSLHGSRLDLRDDSGALQVGLVAGSPATP